MGQRKSPQKRKGRRRTRSTQKGGILPLAALIPALIAGGKAIAAGTVGGAASYGVKKGLEAVTKKRKKKKGLTAKQIADFKKAQEKNGKRIINAPLKTAQRR